MFKKKSPIQISGKWKYYPQRDLEANPITTDDVIGVMAVSNQESGSEFLRKHLNFINTSLEREFVTKLVEKMSDEADAIYEMYESSPMQVDYQKIALLLSYGYCFAMTENLFDIARKGLISGACRDAMREFVMLMKMDGTSTDDTHLALHCLYRGFELCRQSVPINED